MRTTALILLTIALLGGLLAAGAAPAHANGILVTDASMPVVMPPDRTRPPPIPPQRWAPVRLKSHRVSAQVIDQTAEVTVEQTFHSDADRQLEGTYLFPLPEGAAVGKFAMTMGGRMVEGAVIEANEARRIYQSIVSRRRDPGLLEYMGRGLFQARVFPIEPRSDLTIRLVFQMVLRDDAGTLEFRYPLASERLNGQPVEEVVVDVKVESAVDIKTVWSPSHEVAIAREGERKARVSFERSGRKQDKDFLLYIGRSPDAVGFSLVSTRPAGEDGTFFAVFAPRQTTSKEQIAPKDVVYVIDTSGSMLDDGKMDQARRALRQGVSMLRNGDRFNVVAFATSLNPFREGLVEANDETRAAALAWINDLKADGGTNIEGGIQAALQALATGRLSLVVFITDGRPTVGERNAEELLKKAQAWNTSRARIFTFGVGNDLDVGLLDRLAEGTNGTRDYVAPGEDLELVTGRFFTKVDRPVLTDITVELGAGIYDVYPQRIPDLFAGGQVVLFGRYKDSGPRTLLMKGKMGGRDVVHEHTATFATGSGAAWLPRLWAARKVAFLLDDIRLRGAAKETVDEVIRLATRYAIVTPYTAGLVVEDSELEGRTGGPQAERPRLGAAVPPGLRSPHDASGPSSIAPAPTGGSGAGGGGWNPGRTPPPSTPPPAAAPAPKPGELQRESEDLKKLKEAAGEKDKDDSSEVARAKERVQAVGTRSFVLRKSGRDDDGRWVDTGWDGKKETTKVEAYSEAWMTLMAKGDEVAKILALGERLVFVLGDVVYEIIPPAAPK